MKTSALKFLALFGAHAASAFTVTPTTTNSRNVLFMSDGESAGDRKTGTVKWFNTEKGYGFIVPDEEGSDIFVHQTGISAEGFRSLADGEPVEFFVEQDERTGKSKASDVTGPGRTDVQGAPFEAGY